MLPSLIAALVPVVVSFVESMIPQGATPSQKHEWVLGFFQDAGTALAKLIPSWLAPEMSAIETLLADLVQAELNKVLPLA